MKDQLTPLTIVENLDKYIIGQTEAKKSVAIALRNRWRRMNARAELRNEIMPNNILMIGPTGVGKTEIARRLAGLAGAPFCKVEASKFTEVGYVGRDVESMVRDLVEHAVQLVSEERKAEVKEKAAALVNQIILDKLIPPLTETGSQDDEAEINQKTRVRFKEKLATGELDHREIEITVRQSASGGLGIMGPMGIDEGSMANLQDMISNMMPKRSKTRKLPISEARKILLEEEMTRLIDMDDVKEKAIERAQTSGIIFIDEIDKVAARQGNQGADVSREGVQRDLLPIVEGSTVNTKYGLVKTDHVLFISAGAFHVSKPSDLIPELQGRFPIRVELNSLTEDDFLSILVNPKNALTKQYIALFESEGVEIKFEPECLKRIAAYAFKLNAEVENIGARRLHTVLSQLLSDLLFEVPDRVTPGSVITITPQLVDEKLEIISADTDLNKYIL